MMYYFNNCRAYDHEELYGAGAFYDLRTTGQQATQATKLRQGDQCVVVTRTTNGYLVFTWFAFQCERLLRDNTGAGPYRVNPFDWNRVINPARRRKSDSAPTRPADRTSRRSVR